MNHIAISNRLLYFTEMKSISFFIVEQHQAISTILLG